MRTKSLVWSEAYSSSLAGLACQESQEEWGRSFDSPHNLHIDYFAQISGPPVVFLENFFDELWHATGQMTPGAGRGRSLERGWAGNWTECGHSARIRYLVNWTESIRRGDLIS